MLTKEEYEILKNEGAEIAKDYQEMGRFYDEKCEELDQARKEMVREILQNVYGVLTNPKIWAKLQTSWWLENGECYSLKEQLNEIAKQHGVEVDE